MLENKKQLTSYIEKKRSKDKKNDIISILYLRWQALLIGILSFRMSVTMKQIKKSILFTNQDKCI